jgi:hypothetical protein
VNRIPVTNTTQIFKKKKNQMRSGPTAVWSRFSGPELPEKENVLDCFC